MLVRGATKAALVRSVTPDDFLISASLVRASSRNFSTHIIYRINLVVQARQLRSVSCSAGADGERRRQTSCQLELISAESLFEGISTTRTIVG